MKNFLATLAVLFTLNVPAQFIQLWYAIPGVLCPGDTLTVQFSWNNQPGTSQFNMACWTNNHIWSFNNNHFYTLPKVVISGDTVYTIRLGTPVWWPLGPATISPDWVTTIPLYFWCPPVGVIEHKDSDITPVYYDLNGEIILPQLGQILIEKKGLKVKKVVIEN